MSNNIFSVPTSTAATMMKKLTGMITREAARITSNRAIESERARKQAARKSIVIAPTDVLVKASHQQTVTAATSSTRNAGVLSVGHAKNALKAPTGLKLASVRVSPTSGTNQPKLQGFAYKAAKSSK